MSETIIHIEQEMFVKEKEIVDEKIADFEAKKKVLQEAISNASDSFSGKAAEAIITNITEMIIRMQVDVETTSLMMDYINEYCEAIQEADNQLSTYFDGMVFE
ncbi:MAG: hypothetical protein ACK5LC_06480 [Coprobacillaceae bacterium]